MLRRRTFVVSTFAIGAMPWAGASAAGIEDTVGRLRAGGCAVLLRHAQTTAGIGDPAGFDLAVCSTQRNLSDAGRAQAVSAGAWFRARGLKPHAVLSSAWCRCKDTADLAFGGHTLWPPLDSTFGADAGAAAARAAMAQRLASLRPGVFEVWVTHQVNITALTGVVPAMGEGLVLDGAGKLVGRGVFA
ncbi:MAG: histidine phosphatase family protein [Variovorax sp.]